MPIDHFTFGAVTPTLSYTLSVLGSLLGLVATARARLIKDPKRRGRWLLLGAWAIGGTGIWVMHFMAMIGFSVVDRSVTIRYDLPITVASWLTAIVVVSIGIFIVGYGRPNPVKIIFAGVFTGSGVAAMHYTGMAAMRMPAMVHYDRNLVIASVVIAIVASTVALWFTVTLKRGPMLVVAALVMGIAVNGMHFTGMFAMSVSPDPEASAPSGFQPMLFVAPIALFVIIVFVVLLTALINRDDTGSGGLTKLVPSSAPISPAVGPQQGSRIAGAFGQRPKG